jgi:hypothetical protein
MTGADQDGKAAIPKETREQRLARALRDNLRRRKAAPPATPDPSAPEDSR